MTGPLLVILGGLPGTGKTTIARLLAKDLGAAHLRIDTIEQSLHRSGLWDEAKGGAGYAVAWELAADNLAVGRIVIADSVNPIAITRRAWREAAERGGAPFAEVHIHCSDLSAHRVRVETRTADIAGHSVPRWVEVETRAFEPWPEAHALDTAGRDPGDCVAQIVRVLSGSR